jgi:streptogramin lyase
MRRAATFLLVAALVGVGVAAAVDGIRGGEGVGADTVQAVDTGPVVIDAEEGDDPAELAVDASVPVQRPLGVAVAGGSVWAASGDALVRIDAPRASVEGSTPMGGRPAGVVGSDEGVFVLDQLTGDAIRVDTATADIVGRLDADIAVLDVALTDGDAWIPDPAGSAVLRVDPFTGVLRSRIVVAAPTAVVAGAGGVWALSPGGSVVTHIDPASNLASVIALDDPPGQVAVVGGTVWVSHPADGTLSRIDPARDVVTARVELGSEPLLIAAGVGGLWVLGVERLAWVEAATGRVTGETTLELAEPPGPQPGILGGLAASENSVWIADTYGDAVLRVTAPG